MSLDGSRTAYGAAPRARAGGRVVADRGVGDVLASVGLPRDWGSEERRCSTFDGAASDARRRGDLFRVESYAPGGTCRYRLSCDGPTARAVGRGLRCPQAARISDGEGHDDSARRVRPGRVGPDRIQTTDSGISAGREYACLDSDPATRHGLEVDVQPGRGAPAGDVLAAAVGSWTDSEVAGIRYFSGTGTYTRRFDLSPALLQEVGESFSTSRKLPSSSTMRH